MMKKLLSLALTLAMLCCMATTASAETYHVVGQHGNADINVAGVDSITNGLNSTDVTVEVSVGDTYNKYAVDLEYTPINMSINGSSLTWDVNELAYKTDGALAGLNDLENQTITVKNYSDLPVNVISTITDADGSDGISIAYADDSPVKNTTVELAKATPASAYGAGDGAPATTSIVFNVTAETNWDAVIEYYTPKLTGATKKMTVATISVTISQVS